MSGRPKGTPKTGGRIKGTPNKNTAALKDAILEAGHRAGGEGGLVGYLEELAKNVPTAFSGLLGKVLPLTLAGDKDAPLEHNHHIPATDAERAAAIVALLQVEKLKNPSR